MKPRILIPTAVLTIIASVAPSGARAKDRKTPSPTPSAVASAEASTATKKPRAFPYHGKVTSVDPAGRTFVIGKRTFAITNETKITKDGATAQISDITTGELVGGSYWKKDDGTLEARTVKVGAQGTTALTPMSGNHKKAETKD